MVEFNVGVKANFTSSFFTNCFSQKLEDNKHFNAFWGFICLHYHSTSWLAALSKHSGDLVTMNSMGKMGEEYFGISPRWLLPVFTIVVLVGLMLFDFLRNVFSKKQLLTWLFVFLAIVPNVFVTDTEHFLYSISLVFLLLNELREARKWFYWLFSGLGMLFFSFNSTDLLGKELARIVIDSGCLGIGNLLFISLYLYLHFQNTKIQLRLSIARIYYHRK